MVSPAFILASPRHLAFIYFATNKLQKKVKADQIQIKVTTSSWEHFIKKSNGLFTVKFLKLCPTKARWLNPLWVFFPLTFSHPMWQIASVVLKSCTKNINMTCKTCIVTSFATGIKAGKMSLLCGKLRSNWYCFVNCCEFNILSLFCVHLPSNYELLVKKWRVITFAWISILIQKLVFPVSIQLTTQSYFKGELLRGIIRGEDNLQQDSLFIF